MLGAATLTAVGCIAILFQYELRLVSARLGWTLLGLRMAAILVLAIALLEPVWSWVSESSRRPRVLVAVDVSASMDTHDEFASPAEKLRWAKGLGLIGNARMDERLSEWIAAYEAGETPQWADPDGEQDEERAALMAEARRANVEELFATVEGLSRLEVAHRLLTNEPFPLVRKLSEHAAVTPCLFSETSAVLDVEGFLESSVDDLSKVPRDSTDLMQPLLVDAGGDQASLTGVVLVSDGRDTSAASQAETISRIAGLGIPVHTILVGSERKPRDLSIADVVHPDSVLVDDQVVVNVVVNSAGYETTMLKVTLTDESGELAPLEEEFVPAAPSAEVSFTIPKLAEGRYRFRAAVESQPDELREDNNERSFGLAVVDDRADVLLVDGEARWEFRYLDAALKRDDRIDFESVLLEQPYIGLLPRPFFPTQVEFEAQRPASAPTTFAGYDLVIVGDLAPSDWPAHGWRDLDRYVRDEGGSVLFLAGKRHYRELFRDPTIAPLLPLDDPFIVKAPAGQNAVSARERGFHLRFTPDGGALPMFQLDADPVASRRLWRDLPGHPWGIAGEARRGASVWAVPDDLNLPNTLQAERENALVAQHFVGTGQVLWLGIDSTWRWRYLAGDRFHHQFWGQLARWAVSFKASAGNDYVRLGVQRSIVNRGESVVVRSRWDENFLDQHPNLVAKVRVRRSGADDPPLREVPLLPVADQPLVREAVLDGLPEGDFDIELHIDGEPDDEPVSTSVTVRAPPTRELVDVSANRVLLQEIASKTGGRFFYLDEVRAIPELFDQPQEVDIERKDVTMWDHWWVLAAFCLLMTAEWSLRKLNGLP